MGRHVAAAVALTTLLACSTQRPELLDCSFIPVESREDELLGCAYMNQDGHLVLQPATIEAVRRRGADPVAALVGSTLYYLDSAGRSAPVLWYDNGADYFAEGLARSARGGKVGFVDRTLTERIAPTWDFAFPFENGFAMVCQGCRSEPVGEHREVRGGLWGYINREGTVVVPVQFEREHLPPSPQP
jgi:hypothetical protein